MLILAGVDTLTFSLKFYECNFQSCEANEARTYLLTTGKQLFTKFMWFLKIPGNWHGTCITESFYSKLTAKGVFMTLPNLNDGVFYEING